MKLWLIFLFHRIETLYPSKFQLRKISDVITNSQSNRHFILERYNLFVPQPVEMFLWHNIKACICLWIYISHVQQIDISNPLCSHLGVSYTTKDNAFLLLQMDFIVIITQLVDANEICDILEGYIGFLNSINLLWFPNCIAPKGYIKTSFL